MAYLLWIISKLLGIILIPVKILFYKKDSNKCVLLTYSGANNTGAEARTIEAIQQIREASDNKYQYYFITLNKKNTLRYFEETNDFKVIGINHIFFLFNLIPLYLKSNMVILIEGSGFRQNFSSTLLWFFNSALTFAQSLRIKTIAYAVDAGKLSNANKYISKRVINKLNLNMTRTHQAAEVMKSWGVKNPIIVNTGTAFSFSDSGNEFVKKVFSAYDLDINKSTVAIAFKDFFYFPVDIDIKRFLRGEKKHKFSTIYYHNWNNNIEKKSTEFKQMIASLISEIQTDYGYNVILIAMEGMDEEPTVDINLYTGSDIPIISANEYNANEIAAILRNIQFLITTRYHAFVLSMKAKVPTIAISHDERLESLMEELNFKNDLYFEYNSYTPNELQKRIVNAFKYTHDNGREIKNAIDMKLKEYVALANNNGIEFRRFLEKINSN